MARHDLIASYAGELSDRLGGRAGTVAAEALDHLRESVDARVARGVDRAQAEREAIAAFGASSEVAAGYVVAGVGFPTRFTRAAGLASLVAACSVTGGLATIFWANVAERSQPWDALPRTLWTAGILAIVAGVVLSAVGAAGLLRRQGRNSGWSWIVVTLLGLAAITALAAWFVWLWVTALAVGAWVMAARLRRADLGPRRAVLRAGLGAAGAAAVPWLLLATRSIEASVLGVDVLRAGVALGLIVWASGLGALGWWLFREFPTTA